MLRAGIDGPEPLIIAGLSSENVRMLKNDQAISIQLRTFGVNLPGQLVICYGETELDLKRQLTKAEILNPENGTVDPRSVELDGIQQRHAGDQILICTVGLPRSGKSTWAKDQALPIVNPDSVRLALHGQRFIAEAEPMVWAITKIMVRSLFLAGHERVILDACNNTRKRRDEWKMDKWAVFFKYFDADLKTCQARAYAVNDSIGPIIFDMAQRHEPLGDDEERWP